MIPSDNVIYRASGACIAAKRNQNICVQESAPGSGTFICCAGMLLQLCYYHNHSQREYNGYKVYWETATQVTPPHGAGDTESNFF